MTMKKAGQALICGAVFWGILAVETYLTGFFEWDTVAALVFGGSFAGSAVIGSGLIALSNRINSYEA